MYRNRVIGWLLPLTTSAIAGCAAPVSSDSVASESAALSASDNAAGVVFTMSNSIDRNRVLAFHRAADGTLSAAGEYETGGRGSGSGIGSQGALVLTADGRWLIVANPGSDDVTAFAVEGASLRLASRASSGGVRPVSVAVRGGLVYALNAGGTNNVSGLRLDEHGELSPIADSTRPLSAATTAPAQAEFMPGGDALVVTEKATNMIDTFSVRRDGTLDAAVAHPSSGATPFGFAITQQGHVLVSEAFGGGSGRGAMSSYSLSDDGGLAPISASVPNHQTAPCWVVATNNARYAYVSNTGTANVSAYAIDPRGRLDLLHGGNTATTGAGSRPIDMAIDRGSQHLFVLNAGTRTIRGFQIEASGALTPTGEVSDLPPTTVGLAAK
jgi:6-phosphogluconolactonase